MAVFTEKVTKKDEIVLDFHPISTEDKSLYEKYLFSDSFRGCELSFSNLICWGKHEIAYTDDFCVLFSSYGKFDFYPYPIGRGDVFPVLKSIISDAKKRGVPTIINSIPPQRLNDFLDVYGDCVKIEARLGSFDYVYSIDDLATLGGKKYQKKRNHLNNFKKAFPDYKIEQITKENIHKVAKMSEIWYKRKQEANPENDISYEHNALFCALENFEALKLDGIMITSGGDVLAFTMGSRLLSDTFDIQFEKAIPEAYSAINYEFANYIKSKYPDIKFLDREEDMGVEGLRRAKSSYYPHHMTEKYRARFMEDEDDN